MAGEDVLTPPAVEPKREKFKLTTDTVNRQGAELRSSLSYRAAFGREERWKRYVKRLAHIYYDGRVAEESPTINIMAARVRAMVPMLAIGLPSVKVESYFRPQDPNAEPALAHVLEMLWRSEKMDDETRRVTLDAETFGMGIGFVGYETAWGDEPIARQRRLLGIMPPGITDTLSDWTGGLTDPLSVEHIESVKRLLSERIFMERVSPFDFYIDPTAAHFDKAQYMGRKLYLTEKQAESLFGKNAPKATSVGNVGESDMTEMNDPFSRRENTDYERIIDQRVRRVVAYEHWNIADKSVVYFDESGAHIKGSERKWATSYHSFPFIPMLWDEIPDRVYPEGLAATLEPLNNELNLIRKRQLQELRKGIRKWKSSGPMSEKARRGLLSEQDGELIEMTDYDQLEPLEHQPLPPDMFRVEERVKGDMDEVSHTSPMQAAAQQNIRRTATDTAFIQSSADAMVGFRQLMVESFAQRTLEVMLALVTSVFDVPLPIKLANQDPDRPDDITGEPLALGTTIEYMFVGTDHAGFYKVTVEPGSMVASAKDVERQHLIALRNVMAPEEYFDKRAFDTLLLSTMPSIRDASRFIKTDEQMQPKGSTGNPAGFPPPLGGPMGATPPAGAAPPTYGEVNPTAEGDLLSSLFGGMAPQGGAPPIGAGTGVPPEMTGGM